MKFGIVFEGLTDYITLENILCGFFEELETDEIKDLQPQLDETDEKQLDFGGWEKLVDYLKLTSFRDAVLNMDYVIIQIDTDKTEHINFNVSYNTDIPIFIENVKNRLISFINQSEPNFYENNANKIIFAICVRDLECWIYACHNKESLKNPKTTGCGNALNHLLSVKGFDGTKDKKLYQKYSKDFLNKNTIQTVAQKAPSFKHFIGQLQTITLN